MKINNYKKGRNDMIDLYMHTKYSDGTDSVQELLSNATKANLDTISITDHNTCNAYVEMEKYNVSPIITLCGSTYARFVCSTILR